MDVEHLRFFVHLAETQSISRTADHFNMSQPAMSRCISLLEAELGFRLFDRTPNRLHLNEHGKLYLKTVEQALSLLSTGSLAAVTADRSTVTLKLGCYFWQEIIAQCAAEFSAAHPEVIFQISANENCDFDFYALHSAVDIPAEATRESHLLFSEEYYLITASDYSLPSSDGNSVRLADLKNEKFIAYESDNLLVQDATHRFCEEAGFYPRKFIIATDLSVKLRLVSHGWAVAIIPACCLSSSFYDTHQFRRYRISDVNTRRMLYLSVRESDKQDPIKASFVSHCKRFFRDYVRTFQQAQEDAQAGQDIPGQSVE